jgi:putative heme-binding domain-containing protein
LTGPDLTGVGQRFDDRTLLESILEPSKVVSDQYATVEINTREGESFVGRIGDQNDQEILLKSDLLNPANIRRIRWADIESVVPSTASLMPPGLLGPFTEAEILDLVAFLKAPGAPAAATPLREPDVIYVPTPQSVVDQMIAMAELKPGDVLYDLGCGDGRIVVTAARRHGIRAVGVDIHPDRVRDSLANVRSNRVDHLVTIRQADLFTLDFSDATVVTLYLLPELNVRLMPTLARLKPGTRILTHDFSLGNARPVDVHRSYPQGPDSDDTEHVVYKYLVPWTLNDGATP